MKMSVPEDKKDLAAVIEAQVKERMRYLESRLKGNTFVARLMPGDVFEGDPTDPMSWELSKFTNHREESLSRINGGRVFEVKCNVENCWSCKRHRQDPTITEIEPNVFKYEPEAKAQGINSFNNGD